MQSLTLRSRHGGTSKAVTAHAQALGWLVMLLPTQQAARRDGDWDAWLRAWLALWGQVYHSAYWNTLWLHLVARLAKHDTAGARSLQHPDP